MRLPGSRKGMTLTETIISLAILGILAATFFGVFSSGFSGIISAGKYSQAEYEAQKYMEDRLAGLPVAGIPGVTSSTISTTITINFGSPVISVAGRLERINSDDGRHQVDLSAFIPD